jgi:hypothetical protein
VETESSSSRVKKPGTYSYPELDITTLPTEIYFLKIHFNNAPPFKPRFSRFLYPAGFVTKPLYAPLPCPILVT